MSKVMNYLHECWNAYIDLKTKEYEAFHMPDERQNFELIQRSMSYMNKERR